jgi:hypothetical protein
MKTKKLLTGIIALIAIIWSTTYSANAASATESIIVLKGQLVEQGTNNPIAYANVYVDGENEAIVSNNDGEFLFKIPEASKAKNLTISRLGFTTKKLKINEFVSGETMKIVLIPEPINLSDVVIQKADAIALIQKMLSKIADNYDSEPYMGIAYYREIIMQNRRYAGLAEAVMQVYKANYTGYASDRIKILKGRKSADVKRMDTVLFKLKGVIIQR